MNGGRSPLTVGVALVLGGSETLLAGAVVEAVVVVLLEVVDGAGDDDGTLG